MEAGPRGLAPDRDGDTALAPNFERIAALIEASDARISALEIELSAINRALPSPAGTGRRHAAFDRTIDLAVSQVDLATRRSIAEGELAGIEANLAAHRAAAASAGRFQPVAGSDGVIWTASRSSGAPVTLGSDLFQVLDCERRFVEAVFAETKFEDIPAGSPAQVQLRGSPFVFNARVVSRHAAAWGATQSAVDAAVSEPHDDGGVKVFLALAPADVAAPGVAEAFCDVGRTAEVRIRDPHFVGWIAQARGIIDRLFVRDDATTAALGR